MAWSSLASNQMVSYTDAQGGGFTLQSGQSNVTSNQCMTKSEALAKYVLNASNMASYASNQLVPKSVWSTGVSGIAFDFGTSTSTTSSGSCSLSNTGITYYSADSVLVVGSRLFFDSALTNPVYADELVQTWFHSGNKSYRIYNYPNPTTYAPYIAEIVDCSISSRTQITNEYNDPCGVVITDLWLDTSGLYYTSQTGSVLFNGTTYKYLAPNPPLYLWQENSYVSGVKTVISTTGEYACSPLQIII